MYSAHAKPRVTAAIAGLLIAGSGLLVTITASAADAQPGAAPGYGTSSAPAAGGTTAPTNPPGQAAEPTGRVVSQLPLSIREQPTTASAFLGSRTSGAVIHLHCKVVGQNVDGNTLWYELGDGRPGYVAARYVQNLSPVPYCS